VFYDFHRRGDKAGAQQLLRSLKVDRAVLPRDLCSHFLVSWGQSCGDLHREPMLYNTIGAALIDAE